MLATKEKLLQAKMLSVLEDTILLSVAMLLLYAGNHAHRLFLMEEKLQWRQNEAFFSVKNEFCDNDKVLRAV